MTKCFSNRDSRYPATILAGIIAGTFATLVQVLLWLIFTDEFPSVLFRDARLTAALILGSSVLPPPATFDVVVMLIATYIHFTLSIVYTAVLAALAARLATITALLVGIGFGVALYLVNLYGFTLIFPWFAQARGWIALLAHGVFGITAISAYRYLSINNARSQADEH